MKDITILCLSEILAYLRVFPRELHPDQISELRTFMFGGMLDCDHVIVEKGEGPFVSHYGRTRERIPVMRLSLSKYVKLTSLYHMPAPRKGNPPFVPYVPPPAPAVGEETSDGDALIDPVVDETNLDDPSSSDGEGERVAERVVCSSGSEYFVEAERGVAEGVAESSIRVQGGVDVEHVAVEVERVGVDIERVGDDVEQPTVRADVVPSSLEPSRVLYFFSFLF